MPSINLLTKAALGVLVLIVLLLRFTSTVPSTSPTSFAISLIDFRGIIPLISLDEAASRLVDAIASLCASEATAKILVPSTVI